MGFIKPSAPSTPQVVETPPVVSETLDRDTRAGYDQKAGRRKGLLSTILSRHQTPVLEKAAPTAGSQSTLG